MALAKCRECGAEVSDSAKACPKCGISKPVKKTSLLLKLILAFFALVVIGEVFFGGTGSSTSGSDPGPSNQPARPSESDLANNVEVKRFTWDQGGLGTVMLISTISIENKNKEGVKDFVLECTHTAPSGTVIDKNTTTIYQVLPAGKTSTLKDINMGFIHNQVAKTYCKVVSVKRL